MNKPFGFADQERSSSNVSVLGVVSRYFRMPTSGFEIMAILLSLVSMVTTIVGFSLFFGNLLLAIVAGAAVQSILYTTSMEFGRIANRRGKNGLVGGIATTVIMAACLFASSVFSAAFFWDEIFAGRQAEQARESTVRTQVAISIEKMSEDRRTARVEKVDEIRNGPAFSEWEANFATLADLRNSASANLVDLQRKRIAAIEDNLQDAERQRDQMIRDKAGQTSSVTTRKNRLEELKQDVTNASVRIESLERQHEAMVKEAAEYEEERFNTVNGLDGTPAICGAICERAIRNRDEAQGKADVLLTQLTAARSERDAANKEIAELNALIAAGAGSAPSDEALKAINEQIGELKQQIADARAELRGGDLDNGAGFTSVLDPFRNTLSVAAYETARRECQGSIDLLKEDASVSGQLSGVSCDSAQILRLAESLKEFTEAETAFSAACGRSAPKFSAIRTLTIDEALTLGEECVALSQLSTTKSESYRQTFDKLKREQTGDAFIFTRAQNAWAEREGTLQMALVSAFGFDALILLCGYLAAIGLRETTAGKLKDAEKYQEIRLQMFRYPSEPPAGAPVGVRFAYGLISRLEAISPPAQHRVNGRKQNFVAKLDLAKMRRDLSPEENAALNQKLEPWVAEYGFRKSGDPGEETVLFRVEVANRFYEEIKNFFDDNDPSFGGPSAQNAAFRQPIGVAGVQVARDLPGSEFKKSRSVFSKASPDAEPEDEAFDEEDIAARFAKG